ncbi:matrixin family metalloprotease [Arsukibacterium indicum]|uniref:Matrixin family metalloprotease n=1 Tax=Arsukibacterium indicum TaxID=2848612 RepID=A0ABS6MIW2_9GAMM|nr:matrixin family metalloprotease [Arsukibacterium indicum]MBV2128550.1 matrixin family metalloprotease [Arsukibacterium indicum]
MLARLVFLSLLLLGSYLLLSALAGAKRTVPQVLEQRAEQAMQQRLCQIPVLWRIGQLDPAFSLTAEQAEQTAHNAAAQWNAAFGQELFRYDSVNGFPINFRYDERQQNLLQQALLERNISRYDTNIVQRAATLRQQGEQLQQRQREFEQLNQQLAANIAQFQQQAANANQSNVAALKQQQQVLQQRQQQLQRQADQLNQQQAQLQREHEYLNDTVADRNALLADQQPLRVSEVGIMEITSTQRKMTIFAYSTPAALQLTLAHEFGHALGLGHTDSTSSVMYFALNPQQRNLTTEDIDALKQQCGF